jgi:hypothetical protein
MDADEVIFKHQATQQGLVTFGQLRDAGLSRAAIRHRLERGMLVRVRSQVYAHPATVPSFERDVVAAVLAAGPTAFASHLTAARLRQLPAPDSPKIEVSTALERQPRVDGARMHRSGLLDASDVTEMLGVLVASVERTIVDVSGRLDRAALGRVVDDALRRRLTSIRGCTPRRRD